MKTEENNSLSTLTFSTSVVTSFPASMSCVPPLPLAANIHTETLLVALYLPGLFQLQLSSVFPNSILSCVGSALAFFLGSLLPLPPSASFVLILDLFRCSLSIHTALLHCFLDFLHFQMDHSCAWRRLSLKMNQLS